LRPRGRSHRKMCSRSGAEAEAAPSVAGSSGPREAASRAIAKTPLRISKRRLSMSSCGTRSHARCSGGPRASAATRERVSAPSAAPVATWRETITDARSTSSVGMSARDRQRAKFKRPQGSSGRSSRREYPAANSVAVGVPAGATKALKSARLVARRRPAGLRRIAGVGAIPRRLLSGSRYRMCRTCATSRFT
jgi:hypothetical protein